MKKISVVAPCYYEELSVRMLYEKLTSVFATQLTEYDYEIVFADDDSRDGTRAILRGLCQEDPHVKAVLNAGNFGLSRNVFASLQRAEGDAVFLVFGDLQDPPELLPEFIKKWETGKYRVVIGQKTKSAENRFMSWMRKLYYAVVNLLSDKKQIRQFNGFGLYDKSFIEVLRQIEDPQPYLKAVVAEYAGEYGVVPYEHRKSARGRSNFNFYRNYDFAMEGITSSTKKLMRCATFCGAGLGVVSAIYGMYVLIRKLLFWSTYPAGLASIMVGVFLIGSLQLFFIGVLGEYVLSINTRTMRKPRVVVGEWIGFEPPESDGNTDKLMKHHQGVPLCPENTDKLMKGDKTDGADQ